MLAAILVGLACGEGATPLPPTTRTSTKVAKQMVSAGGVRGYLVRPEKSSEGVLLLASQLDAVTRRQAQAFTGSTVLAIEPPTSIEQSEVYLRGLSGITRVRIVCAREACPEFIPVAE